jgi:hypothetical protein
MDHVNNNDGKRTTVQPLPARRRQHRKRQPAHAWGDGVPTLATLASPHGFRVYRDKCGDENIPGRFGEVFRHGPGCLAVQFGGLRANGTRLRDRRKVRWRLQQARRTVGLRRFVVGEEEVIFHFPDTLLPEVAQMIEAYQAYPATRRSVPVAEAA